MKSELIAWMAGLFEGEGSITIWKRRIQVVVEMTDKDIIDRISENFGGYVYAQKQRKTHWKPSWKWILTNREEVIKFLNSIEPFLGERRKKKVKEVYVFVDELKKADSQKTAKISERDYEIYNLKQTNITDEAIAELYSLDRSTVSKIVRRVKLSCE